MSDRPQDATSRKASSQFDLSHTIHTSQAQICTKFIGQIDIEPQQQSRITLGEYAFDSPAQSFSIGFKPEPISDDVIATVITPLEDRGRAKLVLHVANFSGRAFTAYVWEV